MNNIRKLPNTVNPKNDDEWAYTNYFHTTNDEEYKGIESNNKKEGKNKFLYTQKYERNSINREKAIKIHSTQCAICGFDFEEVYGERGKGFIEIHHRNLLSKPEEERQINPQADLIPVCSK